MKTNNSIRNSLLCSFIILNCMNFFVTTAADEMTTNEITQIKYRLQNLEEKLQKLETKVDADFVKTEAMLKQNRIEFRVIKGSLALIMETLSNKAVGEENIATHHPKSCTEALELDDSNGIYKIFLPKSKLKPFDVYCLKDEVDGSAWTVVLRRQDGSVNFTRGWIDYKEGFGNLNGEFFMGLEKLHALTNEQQQELWILLKDFEGGVRYAKYNSFAIGDGNEAYALNILGDYSGDAGNSLSKHRAMKFTTFDFDNDNSTTANCAQIYASGWWFNKCYYCNLNGVYLHGNTNTSNQTNEFDNGLHWNGWRGGHYSLKYAHMALRAVSKPKDAEVKGQK